ncbi:hypothetical protein M0Q97_05685 [Candidatus Dojkabacteria bacterium]|jgi:hypothetical protein|nr:hypothetical protein [Candidatus Dojkabacteria bacterium]
MINIRNNQTFEKTIDIDINKQVTITLRDDEYDELIEKLELSMLEKIQYLELYFKKIEKKENDCYNFIKDIFNVFYHSYDSDSEIVFKKTLPEINEDDLFNVLNKHKKILGLE